MDNLMNLTIVLAMMLIIYFIADRFAKLDYFNSLFTRQGRFGAIDGLGGYLALFVFIHHYIITWYWQNTGKWIRPPEDYFQNFGKVGVIIFFMITGFLFITKMLLDNVSNIFLFSGNNLPISRILIFCFDISLLLIKDVNALQNG